MSLNKQRIAVVGAGIAGSACAHALTQAGHSVHVFDKSRGPGGRLATRRTEWLDQKGRACTARLDHGAIGITARSGRFQSFVGQALHAGWLAEWAPVPTEGSLPLEDHDRLYVPVPDMPELCRRLLDGSATTWSFAVDTLHKCSSGWQVQAAGERHDAQFDAVILALPPTQAAPLLSPHRTDWAQDASNVAMQPCWTLMGIAGDPKPATNHDLARPPSGPLAWVLRSDRRPGRTQVPGQAQWVAHARVDWSREHLEEPAARVQQQMQSALADWLGRPVDWHHCVVHRWLYALPPAPTLATAEESWWDGDLHLGVCGDFLGASGAEGVERAWLSAQSLSAAISLSASRKLRLNPELAITPTGREV